MNRFLLPLIMIVIPSSLFSNTLYFPQVVFGGGYSTTLVIMNTGSTAVSSGVTFYDQSGASRAAFNAPINLRPGGSTRVTLPNTGPLTVLWGEVVAGSGTVRGVATFEIRAENQTLIATAGVPGVEAANSFLLPVDVTPAASTGIAIANVNRGRSFKVGLRLLKEDGSQLASATDVRLNPLESQRQVTDLVTGMFPQLVGTTFKGTLVVESATGTPANSIAATAVTVKEGAISALPVVPGGASSGSTGTLYFPQVAFGGGYSTTFVIMNAGATNLSSRVNFYDQSGTMRVEYSTAIAVPVGGSTRFTLPNSGPLTVVWGELAADPATVTAQATFDFRAGNGALITTAGLSAVEARNSFIFPAEFTSANSTGIAIANVTESPITVDVRLVTEDGIAIAAARDVRLSPLGSRRQIAAFAASLFPHLAELLFKGTLIVEAAAGSPPNSLVATAVNVKERGSASEGAPFAVNALPRELTASERKAVDAAYAFSLALWARINAAQPGSNVFVSPLSASFALGMTLNGAANQTFNEMRSALKFDNATEQEINEGYRSLMALLGSLDPSVKMQIANSIWYRNDFPFNSSFLGTAMQYFDAEVRGLNFADPATVPTINGWVDSKTNHKIPTIIDRIDSDMVMFLINAIYFNGNWREKFNAAQTRDAPFHAADGTDQPMSLMHRRAKMSYVESSTYQAVDLPYGNSAFTMTVLLPKEGTDIESLAASLTSSAWQSLTSGLQTLDVDLSLPKLKLNYERILNSDLKALGMNVPFESGRADFTRMSPRGRELYISFVKQKTFVDIHEEGTEAAAVTVVVIAPTSAAPPSPPPKIMRADRPYIFVIRERLSGTLLFMGKIVRMPD